LALAVWSWTSKIVISFGAPAGVRVRPSRTPAA
jgi:hypothetical protein